MNILFYLPEDANTDLVDYLIAKDLYLILATDDDVFESIDKEPYDMAILYDYKNKPGDITLISRINSRGKLCPIIQVSTCEDIKVKIRLFKSGIAEYIVRPCDYEEFYMHVMAIINLTHVSITTKEALSEVDYYNIGRYYVLDVRNRCLHYKKREVFNLFSSELKILIRLLIDKTKFTPCSELIKAAGIKQRDERKALNTLRVIIHGIRRKLIFDRNILIQVVGGSRGYKLIIKEQAAIVSDTTPEQLAADLL